MGLTASDSGGKDFDPIPQGMHQAICTGIYDLGTQFNEFYGKRQHKVLFCWELPLVRGEFERDGKLMDLPRAISKEYTLSLNEKAILRKELETWRSKSFTEEELKGFDIKRVLGVSCTLQVLHKKKNDRTYANIVGITPVSASAKIDPPENPLRFFSFEDNTDIPEGTPEWIADKIKKAEENKNYEEPSFSSDDSFENDYASSLDDEEIPF